MVLISACGSNSDDDKNPPQSAGGIAAVEQASGFVKTAESDLLYFPNSKFSNPDSLKPMETWLGPTKAVQVPSGKSVALVSCGAPSCDDVMAQSVKLIESLGWAATAINQGGASTVQNLTESLSSAITLKPDAIIGIAVPTQVVGVQLTQAKAAGIFTVSLADNGATGGDGQYDAAARYANASLGQLLGYTVIADSDGKANVLVIDDTGFPDIHAGVENFQTILKDCSSCTVKGIPWQITDAIDPTKASGIVTAALNANPDVDTIVVPYTNGLQAVIGAVRASGRDIEIYCKELDQISGPALKRGDLSGVAASDFTLVAYQSVDQTIRGLAGVAPIPEEQLPILTHVFRQETVPTIDTADFQSLFDYESEYAKLWGKK